MRLGSLFSGNLQYLWNRARYDQGYYWWPIGSRIRAFDRYRNQWPSMTLRATTHSASKYNAFSEPTTKISMKIDPYYQRQWRRAMNVVSVSGNIRFLRIFAGGSLERGRQTTVGLSKTSLSKTSIFSPFGCQIFGILRNKAPRSLSTDPKMRDLEWSWMTILR